MIIANYMATQTDLDEVWLVVSPQNPFKQQHNLADQYARLDLVNLAIGDSPKLRASAIEFQLPKPSYTIDTLTYLREQYPSYHFSLIMGGDNLPSLPKWKNYEILLRDYPIHVYQRPGIDLGEWAQHPAVSLHETVPLMQLSATYIRQCLQNGKSVRYLVPDAVAAELEKRKLYPRD